MGGPYKLKKRGKPMTTIYDAAILLVDDNPDLLTLVTDNLRTAGYKSVCTAADCAAARAAFAAHRPDLMILDITLPDGDGFGLFRTLRTESDVPTLFLSARDADADRLFGLGLGADDYLTKPFSVDELLARLRSTQRRLRYMQSLEEVQSSLFTNGGLTIDYAAGCACLDGEELHLTPYEYKLLCLLAHNVGKVLTHSYITREIWGAAWEGDVASLRVFMASLRKKIEKNPSQPQYIQTHVGVGYRMMKR